jgi:WD40 repeat protein/serine/threonine protein kinase
MPDRDSPESSPNDTSWQGEAVPTLAALLAEQRGHWQRGERIPVEDYLARHPRLAADAEAALDLITNEVLLRREQGEEVGLAEYLRRFPHWAGPLRAQFEVEAALDHDTQLIADPAAFRPAGPAAGLPPPQLAGYEVLGVLGQGGMGIVYQARQIQLRRLVALKMILAGGHAQPEELARFRIEAEAAARLQHPHIVQVYEVGEAEGRPYIALEFCEGGSLTDQLGGTPLPPHQAAKVLQLLARAIHFAHQRGVIHRDLKPANILLASGGREPPADAVAPGGSRHPLADLIPKITDFGLAKAVEHGALEAEGRMEGPLTRTGMRLGTPSYMAPEQALGKSKMVGRAADVYALGAILYELLTGRPPFRGATEMETLSQVIGAEPVPPRRLQPTVPRDLETICLKCLQKEPGRRYPGADRLAEDLDRFLAQQPIKARPVGRGERLWRWCRRNPALGATGALALAAGVAVVLISILFGIREHRATERIRREQTRTAAALKAAQRLSATLALDRGLTLCEQGDGGRGLLWLAHSLEIAAQADDPHLDRLIRANLSGWQRRLSQLKRILPHGDEVCAVAFSRDGRTLLTGSWDGTARFWDAASGRALGQPLRHQARVTVAAFSPDGKTVLTADERGTAKLWKAATGQPVGQPLPHRGPVLAAAFSPDGNTLVTGSGALGAAWGEARLWSAATGRPLGTPLCHKGPVVAVAFHPRDRIALTGSHDGTAQRWDATTGRALGDSLKHGDPVRAVAFSPDGTTMLTGSGAFEVRRGEARLWSAATGRPIGQPLSHKGAVVGVAFHPRDRIALTGSEDTTAQLWDTVTGKALGAPLKHQHVLRAVAFSPDGRLILTGSGDRQARLWTVPDGKLLCPSLPHEGHVPAVAFSPDGRWILTASIKTARLWQVAADAPSLFCRRQDPGVTALAISRDGKTVLTGSRDGTAQLWSMATGEPLGPPWKGHRQGMVIRNVALSPDGKTALTGSDDSTARVWDVSRNQSIALLRHEGPGAAVWSVAFSPDGKTVATGSADWTARLWSATTGRPIGPPLRHRGPVFAVAFRPDGKALLTGSDDVADRMGEIQWWEVARGGPLGKPLRHQGAVWAVALSRDGRTILSGSWDFTARLWEAATGKPIGSPLEHQFSVNAVALSPDGRTALSGSWDGTARLWDVSTSRQLGPPFRHPLRVTAVVFGPGTRVVLTASGDGLVRLWKVPSPLKGRVKRIVHWAQASTGMELVPGEEVIRLLNAATWQERRRHLDSLGGPPLP